MNFRKIAALLGVAIGFALVTPASSEAQLLSKLKNRFSNNNYGSGSYYPSYGYTYSYSQVPTYNYTYPQSSYYNYPSYSYSQPYYYTTPTYPSSQSYYYSPPAQPQYSAQAPPQTYAPPAQTIVREPINPPVTVQPQPGTLPEIPVLKGPITPVTNPPQPEPNFPPITPPVNKPKQPNVPPITPPQPPSDTAPPAANAVNINIQNASFIPARIEIPVGTTVRWSNHDSQSHNVTAMAGTWKSANLAKDQAFTYTFTKAGTYAYQCTIHPQMRGVITVK